MSNNRVKDTIVRWFIPFSVLLIIIVMMLVQFLIATKETEREEAENELMIAAERYAVQIQKQISSLAAGSATAAEIVSGKIGTQDARDIARALYNTTDSYMVAICDKDGRGIAANALGVKEIRLGEEEYLQELSGGKQQYVYTMSDSVMKQEGLIVATPVLNRNVPEGYILQYYSTINFTEMIKRVEFDMEAFYTIVDVEGIVMASGGKRESVLFTREKIWEHIRSMGGNDAEMDRIFTRMQGGNSGVIYVTGHGENKPKEHRAIVYTPAGISDWYIAIGINEDYVDRVEARGWIETRNMVYKLLIAILVFLGSLVIINIICRLRDNEKSKQLENKADTDLLTELNNKVATERKIKEYIAAHPNEQAIVFLLDIDNFKKINDTMGHAFGDEVLRTLGHQIKAEFRASDIIGRLGGDEFIIFLRNINDEAVIRNEAKRVERFFQNFQAGEYVKYSATASIGVAVFPRDGKDFQTLYKAADQALYTAKRRGKNQLAFFSCEP